MNLIDSFLGFFNDKSIQSIGLDQNTRRFNSTGLKIPQADYRINPRLLSQFVADGTVVKCIQLINNYTLGNGWKVKSKFKYQEEQINSFLKSQDIEKANIEILNSILGVNSSILSFFVQTESGLNIKRESFFWNNYQRIWAISNNETKEFEKFEIKSQSQKVIYEVGRDESYLLSALNIENDFLGKSPLFYAQSIIAEKQTLSMMNRDSALFGNRVEGALTPKADLFKELKGNDRMNYLADLGDAIDTIQTNSSNNQKNYALLPPVEFLKFQETNVNMQFSERIKLLNYEICSFYGVAPSLVGFDETTNPSLNNGETQKDIFISSTVNYYKTLLENYWTWILNQVFNGWEFEFFVGREQTDETIKIRESLYESIDAVKKLKEIGIEAQIDISLLNKLGITIKEAKDITGAITNQEEIDQQNDNKQDQLSVIDEIDMVDKSVASVKPKYLELNPPTFRKLEKTESYQNLKKKLKSKIKTQLDGFFSQTQILNKAINSQDLLFQYIQDNLPKIDYTSQELYSELTQTIIPESIKMYNEFYQQNYTIDKIPPELKSNLLELCQLTIEGNGLYEGIDRTLTDKIYNLFQKISKGKGINIDDYANVPSNVKKEIWQELKMTNQTILLQSRTDLIGQIIANNSLNQVVAELSQVTVGKGQVFVGVRTVKDNAVRPLHQINEGKYFDSKLKQPWTDPNCRCEYIYGTEEYLKKIGFTKL